MKKSSFLLALFWVLAACIRGESELFTSIPTERSGISFENTLTPKEDLNILDYLYFYNGGGVAVGDVNND
ncbi:MAG: hypothetical protein AAGA86_06210, partial [Bacteroidota bacterium]